MNYAHVSRESAHLEKKMSLLLRSMRMPEQGPANAAPVQFGVEGGAMRPPRVWIGLNVLKSRVDPGSPVRSR